MIAVIFELEPKQEHTVEYFNLAAQLKEQLATIPGFISVERFKSLTNENKYLSLSFWQDEAAVKTWREQNFHQSAQEKGRNMIFDHYRLRVAQVLRDYGLRDRKQVPDT